MSVDAVILAKTCDVKFMSSYVSFMLPPMLLPIALPLFDSKMVQQSESILSAWPVCDFLFADSSGVHARGRPERSASTPARIARGRHEANLHGSGPSIAETGAVLQNRLSPKTCRYR